MFNPISSPNSNTLVIRQLKLNYGLFVNGYDTYGHYLARKFFAGDQLIIRKFNSATESQVNILKYYLFCAYNSVKYSVEIPFNNLFPLKLLPKLETLDGEELNTHEKTIKWI